jgi:hypothetical protein
MTGVLLVAATGFLGLGLVYAVEWFHYWRRNRANPPSAPDTRD